MIFDAKAFAFSRASSRFAGKRAARF